MLNKLNFQSKLNSMTTNVTDFDLIKCYHGLTDLHTRVILL